MNYSKVTNPVFANISNTLINVTVTFDNIGEVPFTASPDDQELHGKEIFAKCIAGDFGEIVHFIAPIKSIEQLTFEVKAKRNQLLSSTDWTQLPDVPEIIKTNWIPYRQALRDITLQTGFPTEIVWPVKPV